MQKISCNEPATIPTTTISESSEEASSPTKLLDPQTIFPRLNNNQFIVAATLHKAVDARKKGIVV